MKEIAEEVEILNQERQVEPVLGFEGAFHFRRGRLALLVEGPTRGHADQGEGQEADDQKQRNHPEEAAEKVHGQRMVPMARAAPLL
jgi:hypothetical protein